MLETPLGVEKGRMQFIQKIWFIRTSFALPSKIVIIFLQINVNCRKLNRYTRDIVHILTSIKTLPQHAICVVCGSYTSHSHCTNAAHYIRKLPNEYLFSSFLCSFARTMANRLLLSSKGKNSSCLVGFGHRATPHTNRSVPRKFERKRERAQNIGIKFLFRSMFLFLVHIAVRHVFYFVLFYCHFPFRAHTHTPNTEHRTQKSRKEISLHIRW